MSPLVLLGLEAISARTNVETGLSHQNDKNAAKEMFVRLHSAGEKLSAIEIEFWALADGWRPRDARELGHLAAQIDAGHKPRITGGPWWRADALERLILAAEGTAVPLNGD